MQYGCSHSKRHRKNRTPEHANQNWRYFKYTACGLGCSILKQSLASQMIKSSPHAFWVRDNANPQLRTFSNEAIRMEGKVQTPVSSNDWTARLVTFTVVADSLKSLICRDLIDQLRLAVTQSSSSSGNQSNTISPYSEFNESIEFTFSNLISRIGHSKNHVVKSKFQKFWT